MKANDNVEDLHARIAHLERAVQECERLSIANRYAAAIMHEVNNPLEALTNLAYLMNQEELPDTARAYLNLLQEQIAVLTGVTRPSLTYFKDQRNMKSVDLVKMVDSIEKLHETRLNECGVQLARKCPETLPCLVVGSELLQVLSNLVINSLDAMSHSKQGSQIHIRIQPGKGIVNLTVADDGPGIPEHLEETLFQPYATGKKQGTGLGLWISRRIVEGHNGSIRARTSRRAGRTGTAFRIVLPCLAAAAAAAI